MSLANIVLRAAPFTALVLGPLGSARAGDFDGDGIADLAVASAHDEVAGVAVSGAIHVLYGAAGTGLAIAGLQVLSPLDFAALAPNAPLDFGAAVAVGDFDGDGDDDLAVGAPGADIGPKAAAGAVAEYRGGSSGLAPRTLWHQNVKGVRDKAEAADRFGSALCAGDFDGDGRDDLAIGVLETIHGKSNAGAVHVLFGSKHGLTAAGDQLWHQDRAGVKDKAEVDDQFGARLCAGDFDGDGRDDLAIAIEREQLQSGASSGGSAVAVLQGAAGGLTAAGDLLFDGLQIGGPASATAAFANALAAGDFDGDGRAELALGDTHVWVGGGSAAGVVYVVASSEHGLDVASIAVFSQDTPGVAGDAADNELFGSALACADFDGDGRAELAIGARFDHAGGGPQVGSVVVLNGGSGGLTASGSTLWSQEDPAIQGVGEYLDQFGSALATGDFDGDGTADLAIGASGEAVGALEGAGAVNVILGAAGAGLHAGGNQLWYEDLLGGAAASAPDESFGRALGS